MKRAPSPRPAWIETCAIEHGSGNVIDFPIIQDLAVAALGGQPRLHRPEPLVRALRRRRPPRLPALRPRPREGTTPFREECGRPRSSCARRSTAWACRAIAKTTGSQGHPCLRAHRARPDAEGGLGRSRRRFAQALEQRPPRPDHRGVPDRQAPAGARARRLQPERLGPDAGLRLLGAPAAAGHRFDPGDLGGGRATAWRSRTSASTTSPPASRASATCGRRFCPRAAASGWTDWADGALGRAPDPFQEPHHHPLARGRRCPSRDRRRDPAEAPVEKPVDHRGVHVALSADRGRIAEMLRHALHGGVHSSA